MFLFIKCTHFHTKDGSICSVFLYEQMVAIFINANKTYQIIMKLNMNWLFITVIWKINMKRRTEQSHGQSPRICIIEKVLLMSTISAKEKSKSLNHHWVGCNMYFYFSCNFMVHWCVTSDHLRYSEKISHHEIIWWTSQTS